MDHKKQCVCRCDCLAMTLFSWWESKVRLEHVNNAMEIESIVFYFHCKFVLVPLFSRVVDSRAGTWNGSGHTFDGKQANLFFHLARTTPPRCQM